MIAYAETGGCLRATTLRYQLIPIVYEALRDLASRQLALE